MNKTAIKNFAIWARNKLIADITYKTGLLGISEKGIKSPLPQSTNGVQFFDIGTKEPYSISGIEIRQREALATAIRDKEKQSDYATAYRSIIEEVAYTWFNRLIAVRFMEVNDYLPSHIRVLSSESAGKDEPDLVTNPFDTDLEFTPYEKDRVMQLKQDNKLDELFRMLFIKQCNTLNAILPNLFEKTSDYTELLLNVTFTDKDGLVYRLVHDIAEDDFNVSKEGQVEIIGWLYQYYNTEPKDETFALLKKNVKITKERIPAATQLFTPDWIVRYMVENSLGRLWLEGHPNETLKTEWKYYLDQAEQEEEVQRQLEVIREEYKCIKPEDIKVIDPCMGSGHILVYAFDVLMQIYESYGYSKRDAAKSIIENNLYGLDIDNRAYQLAYFAVMMKARQYNRRILNGDISPHVYAIQESNGIEWSFDGKEWGKSVKETMHYVINLFKDAKEYGSILNVEPREYQAALIALDEFEKTCELTIENHLKLQQLPLLRGLVLQAVVMAQKYDVVVTNPPYMGSSNMGRKLLEFVKNNFPDSKSDLFAVFIEKCHKMTKKNFYTAMITQHAWMFLSSFEKLRKKLLETDIVNMAHLGARAFEEIGGEVVQTTSFIIRKIHMPKYKGTYCRLIEPITQQGKEDMFLFGVNRYKAEQGNFSKIPGSPIVYWVSESFFKLFYKDNIQKYGEAIEGIKTGDNDRFLRFWFEVNCVKISKLNNYDRTKSKWCFTTKGGVFRKWYGNIEYVMNWENGGHNLKNFKGSSIYASKYNTMAASTWTYMTSGKMSFRFLGDGFFYNNKGPAIFTESNTQAILLTAFLNTKIANYIQNFLNPTLTILPGNIRTIPYIVTDCEKPHVEQLTIKSIKISKQDWDCFENSWDFTIHPLVGMKSETANELRVYATNGMKIQAKTLAGAYIAWEKECDDRFAQLKFNEEKLNRIFIDIYGLQDELTPEVDDKDVSIRKADLSRDIRSLISYAVGCMFGRYSLDIDGLVYAGGEWDASKYKTFPADKDNILPITDEEYFENDIVGLFVAFVKKVYGSETLEENLDFIAKALGNKGNTSREIIRNYFVKDFFKDHCKIYQKRPIYWLFDSGKADGFKTLIYMHRYDENTIGNIRVDYLHKMQRIYEREIARMQETIDNSTDAREVAAAEKRKDKLIKQLKETKDYDEKIAHLALARIPIDLDDGVKVNYEKVQTGTDGKKLEVLAKI